MEVGGPDGAAGSAWRRAGRGEEWWRRRRRREKTRLEEGVVDWWLIEKREWIAVVFCLFLLLPLCFSPVAVLGYDMGRWTQARVFVLNTDTCPGV